jgi:hypothetical protein
MNNDWKKSLIMKYEYGHIEILKKSFFLNLKKIIIND